MDFKNENSKIYFLINIFSILVGIMCIMYFTTDIDTIFKFKIFNIALLFGGLNGILVGTQKVVAQNNKEGYLNYFSSILFISWFISLQC
ncbi:hypothetical protein OW763_14315 [Clostridium aestuarii]|uniref:Uncharacterized protein n=1 Tax=Clostridium aestuarii TaxID=338193 RepID=A0ABT4D2M7_9CLOT|nr:hypothetical protein [Clostridium aestuarii]MCY6485505.1 hypothetical protein [Clostridium aestuarii]